MMTSSSGNNFPRYWTFAWGIHRSPVNSPHKGQWRRALMLSLICACANRWVNHRDPSDLRRHQAHFDVTVSLTNMLIFMQHAWLVVIYSYQTPCDYIPRQYDISHPYYLLMAQINLIRQKYKCHDFSKPHAVHIYICFIVTQWNLDRLMSHTYT